MIGVLQTLWIFLILALMVVRFKVGLSLYLAYIILVPYMSISFGGILLQWNFINMIVLLMAIYEFKIKRTNFKIDFKPLLPFLIYFCISLIMMPFQNGVPIGIQFDTWRMQLMKYMILSFALWNEMRLDASSVKLYRNVALICIAISACYGLFLTTIVGANPYIMLLSITNGSEFNENYALAFGEGRIFGRISSVFTHPMMFGLFLGISLIYVFFNRKVLNKYIFILLFLIITINMIVCGVRSVIAGTVIAIILFLLQTRNFKMVLIAAIIGLVGYNIINSIPELSTYIGSIADIVNQKQDVTGSSLSMRMEQLYGCFEEIDNSLLFGKGFGWTGYYTTLHGDHPIILSFESLIYIILCNSGLIGVLLWAFLIFKIMRRNSIFVKETKVLLNTLLFFYLAYSCITGEYGYMQLYIIFYVLMQGEALLNSNKL